MTQTQLIHALHQIGAVKFGFFTLKSGQTSKIYLDLRQIVSYPDVLKAVSDAIWQTVQHCKADVICGVPYTALPIATCISLKHNIPMIMRRKEKKAYGTKQQIEGKFESGQTCLVIEDVVTTGSSVIETIADLTEAGLKVHDAAVLINREKNGKENLLQHHCQLHSALTLSDILKTLHDASHLKTEERAIIREIMNEFT